jgi:hypothetical protein
VSRQLGTYHPEFGYYFIPGLKARVEHEGGGYLLVANQQGFRSHHDFAEAKPTGTFRILLFGDSCTAGMGVSNADRYGDVLERLIPGVQVFNYAIPGSAPDTQYLVYRTMAADLDHDLIVVAVYVDNIRRIVARFRPQSYPGEDFVWMPKPFFTLEPEGALRLHNSPVPHRPLHPQELPAAERSFLDRVVGRDRERLPPRVEGALQRMTRYDSVPAYRRRDHPDWLLMRAILERWTKDARVPVIVMPIPLDRHIEGTLSPRHYQARFGELDDPPRLLVHDPFPDAIRRSRAERRALRFMHDPHPTAAYHRLLAESLAGPVRRMMQARSSSERAGPSVTSFAC